MRGPLSKMQVMYMPEAFVETRTDVLHSLLRAHPLAAIITRDSQGGLVADHIPVELDPEPAPLGTLRGHFARANPAWREHDPACEVLAIFQGPQTYVSPTWYPSKKATGKVVPTWNYAVVHVHGAIRIIHDVAWLRRLVERLTDAHESTHAAPWQVSDAPPDYIEKALHAIVGFEIRISRLAGKWKMSQNRAVEDRLGIVEGLRQSDDPESERVARILERLDR